MNLFHYFRSGRCLIQDNPFAAAENAFCDVSACRIWVLEARTVIVTNLKPKTATISDMPAVVSALTLAFCADPFMRWMYPDPQQYLAHRPTFFRMIADIAIAHESAYIIGDSGGVALWLPPGTDFDGDEVFSLLQRTIVGRVLDDLFAMVKKAETYHPDEPSWYLPLIAVDPIQQGRGYGSSLLQYSLLQYDRDQKPAYLDNTNPANVPFYEHYGFEVVGTVQVGGSPPWFPMIRQPK
jgi:GNAT superfamily N-acetyltransferase